MFVYEYKIYVTALNVKFHIIIFLILKKARESESANLFIYLFLQTQKKFVLITETDKTQQTMKSSNMAETDSEATL